MTALQRMNGPEPLKLRIADVEALQRAGAFAPFRKVELIEGALYAMNAEYRRHNVVKNRLARRLGQALEALGSPMEAWTEVTLALGETDLPQPDIVVAVSEPDDRYYEVRDLGIVIEVADSTLKTDRTTKAALYARADVPEYWVVDINRDEVLRFWCPAEGVYQAEPPVPLAGPLASLTMPDLVIDGSGIV